MAYEKTVWKNNEAPKINATNLNKIENGIANAVETDSVARVSNVVSRNLANADNYLLGHISSTGAIEFNNDWAYTKVLVEPNTQYTYQFTSNVAQQYEVAQYQNDGTFIVLNYGNFESGTQSFTFTTENNAGYVLVAWRNDLNHSNIQVEKGSSATSYTPYLNLMDAVSLIPLSFIPMNINDTYVHSSDLDYFIVKIGKIVIMNIRTIAFKQALENDYLLASKLPAAAKDIIFYLYGGQSAKGDTLRVRLNTNGDLYVHYSSIEYYANSSNDQYGGTLIYETTD